MTNKLIDFAKAIEADAQFVQKALQGEMVSEFVTYIPELKTVVEEILAGAGEVAKYSSIAGILFNLSSLAYELGARPMDANQMAEDDKKFHYGYGD